MTFAVPPAGSRKPRGARTTTYVWLFLSPTVLLYGAFTVYPIVGSYVYSLTDWNGFDAGPSFIGVANYREVLADPMFWSSFRLTLTFMLVAVPLQVLTTLLVAIVLNSPRMPLRKVFRTALFLPVVTTTAIVGVVMQFVFDPASGPVNLALREAGLVTDGVDFLGQSSTALGTTIAVYVWKWFGITLVYWLAALQTVPDEVYEAARLDGAGALATLRHITTPLLKPFLVIITLLSIEASLQVFDLVLTMTGGGPFYSTEVIEVYIYRWAFAATVPRLGYASAAAVLFGLFVCVIGLLQLLAVRATRKARGAA
ncbi:sugar ABC transporter permease [Nonomuraea mesophila]|uniref:Sugar ABC transporter permease n=1 Tax=Nonomuraea mesophila TaxID=2530382 RepID=A0A4R5FWN5_9ACTN|nr:sugar ABC transporter permease [Nonomuraea mesophila]TDE58410.1 sugar ABC transporter permease [Nonomuraea mesophila]